VFEIPEWPYFLGKPQAVGVIRSRPEDFVVEEIPRFQPEDDGSHLWLWVEKRSANTDWVAKELARAVNCPHRDVGYAGLKDRHAVTRQWFSVPLTDTTRQSLEDVSIEGVVVLESRAHTRKLKRGTLNGNRFKLNIREFSGDADQTAERLQKVGGMGVPNYFGPQRFGHQGQNVEQGYRLLNKGGRLLRNKRSMYLSALRSFLFNQVLAERVRGGVWNTIIDGDLAMLNGTQSIFSCADIDKDIEDRCQCLDIHPTGPMPGENGTRPSGKALELEQAVLQNWQELTAVLSIQRLRASRRTLRLNPAELEWDLSGGNLQLAFVLPPGAYATTVLREVLRTT
jgi:tRNA pseudouridine13 synthase